MTLKFSYTLLAPVYDAMIEKATRPLRQASIAVFENTLTATTPNKDQHNTKVLLCGIGSGLDIPHLPVGPEYTGIDITPGMLKRAKQRAQQHSNITTALTLELGDVMAMNYEDDSFDFIIMHLILAVVPQPQQALLEAERVLKPNGKIFIVDKFLRRGQFAPLRRLISPVMGKIATQTNVIFEDLLSNCYNLTTASDDPALAGGWFRRIVLQKKQREL